jgi:hypothetical protein
LKIVQGVCPQVGPRSLTPFGRGDVQGRSPPSGVGAFQGLVCQSEYEVLSLPAYFSGSFGSVSIGPIPSSLSQSPS